MLQEIISLSCGHTLCARENQSFTKDTISELERERQSEKDGQERKGKEKDRKKEERERESYRERKVESEGDMK